MVIKQKTTREVADIGIGSLRLTSGELLESVTLRYERVGPVDAPTILVCHALTGNHLTVGTEQEPGWWRGLIHEGGYIDTASFQVITFNVLGGCDGSTGPTAVNPATGKAYQASFPKISVRDIVRAQHQALQTLNINRIHAAIGASLGGMQALEWGVCFPDKVGQLIIPATTPYLSDYGIAFNHIAETAIKNDPNWYHGFYADNVLVGLDIARMIGIITYRSSDLFAERFARKQTSGKYKVASYLDYQGEKLRKRFDANSYIRLLQAMNHHDITCYHGGSENVSERLAMPVLAISYAKDLIYEPTMIEDFANRLPNGTYHHVDTTFGHDGFLVEFDKWGYLVKNFLQQGAQK